MLLQSPVDDTRTEDDDRSKRMLDLAARAAHRGMGLVEPNPMVGCVIAKDGGAVLGIGHHKVFGSLHAEREAIANARERGHEVRGATAYVTLEPCCHHGKQPPCTDALIEAGISRVVIARPDPGEVSGGGAIILRDAGIEVEFTEVSQAACAASDAFVKRCRTGMPWVIAKWAQTVDGRIATRTGQSQWISGEPSRKRVHRLRSRVDAILTGLGTMRADDPLLTARGQTRVRRAARRVVVDSDLDTPVGSRLVQTAREVPVTIACAQEFEFSPLHMERRDELVGAGVDIMGVRSDTRRLDLDVLLRQLWEQHEVGSVLLEAGPGLLGAFFEENLVDEVVVYVAPVLLGDAEAKAVATGRVVPELSGGRNFRLMHVKRVGDDVELMYRRPVELAPS